MMYYFDSPFVFVDNVDSADVVKSMTLQNITEHIENNLYYEASDHGGAITNYHLNIKTKNFNLDPFCENKIIWDPLKKMIHTIKNDRDIPVIPKRANLEKIWFNKYTLNTYASPHVHFHSDISGIFVVKNNDKTCLTSFKQETNVGNWMYSESLYDSYIAEGQVALFPSHLTHWVNPVKNDRYVVAFDIVFEQ